MWTASESPIQLLYWLCLNRVRCTSCQSLRRSFYFDPALFNEHVNTTDFMQDHVRNIAALVYKNNHHTIFSQPLTRLGSLWWVMVFYTVSRKPRDRTMNCHSPTSFQISVLETYFDLPAVICGYLCRQSPTKPVQARCRHRVHTSAFHAYNKNDIYETFRKVFHPQRMIIRSLEQYEMQLPRTCD